MSARAYGLCAYCGKPMRSKYPVGDVRRFKYHVVGRDSCALNFRILYYRSWLNTRRAVLLRVRERFGGEVRCENCAQKPRTIERRRQIGQGTPWQFTDTYTHPGYEFDHTVEIVAGGDPLDVGNVRLLCVRCHRRKTARFLKRRTPSARPETLKSLEAFA